MGKANALRIIPITLSAILYVFIAYFTQRHETFLLLTAFSFLFIAYWLLLKQADSKNWQLFVLLGIGFRLLLLFAFPNLSDDIYRFVWDGHLINNGINPFTALPSTVITTAPLPVGISQELFQLLNSPDYYTIYPPFAQGIYWLAAVLSPDNILGSVVVIRILIILAELGTLYYLVKLLDQYGINRSRVVWYSLNPLVILELTGNLHFEAFMICFLLMAVYFLKKENLTKSGIAWALAITSKLLPLMVLPLLVRRLPWKKLMQYFTWIAGLVILAFLLLLSEALWNGMSSSLSLYFQKFEFNASIYYLVREIGFWIRGYNLINVIGPVLALIVLVLIVYLSFRKTTQQIPALICWIFIIYLMFATTVHPWYIITPMAFSLFTRYRFVVVWSFLAFFTYAGYEAGTFQEIYWLTGIEYLLVAIVFIYEYRFKEHRLVNWPMA